MRPPREEVGIGCSQSILQGNGCLPAHRVDAAGIEQLERIVPSGFEVSNCSSPSYPTTLAIEARQFGDGHIGIAADIQVQIIRIMPQGMEDAC